MFLCESKDGLSQFGVGWIWFWWVSGWLLRTEAMGVEWGICKPWEWSGAFGEVSRRLSVPDLRT